MTAAAAALAAALATLPLQPKSVTGVTVGLATVPAKQLKLRGLHMAAAVNGYSGEVVGALLNRAGKEMCTFRGVVIAGQVRVTGCGL
jgi:hypothetical protein